MTCQVRSCSILFRDPIWAHILAQSFGQILNRNILEYILIILIVTSESLVPECFSILCRRFFLLLPELHHIRACSCNNVILCKCLEQIDDSLKKWLNFTLLLIHRRDWFQCGVCLHYGGWAAPHKEVYQAKEGSSMYPTCVTLQF